MLTEIAAGRIADEMRLRDAEMVEQFGDIEGEPVQRQRLLGRRYLRAPMAAQIEPHHAVIARQMRDPREIAPRAAHSGMQQQERRRVFPRVGEIVYVIRQRKAVAGGKTGGFGHRVPVVLGCGAASS